MSSTRVLIFSFIFCLSICGCKEEVKPVVEPTPVEVVPDRLPTDYSLPKWAKKANIYEVDLSKYAEGDAFSALSKDLHRLKLLGIEILVFKPIFPMSQAISGDASYAISDYTALNSDYGSFESFDKMVKVIHGQGMHFILDWVPNRTSAAHSWRNTHKDWYTQDSTNTNVASSEITELNYANKELREEMLKELSFWINERNVDGFRMLNADQVPNDFWGEARDALFAHQKAIFLLSDSSVPEHRNNRYFHATSGKLLTQLFDDIALGKKQASDIDTFFKNDRRAFKKGFQVLSSTSEDKNAGGDNITKARETLAALSATLDGMPMINDGQTDFYTTINKLKQVNRGIWNGRHGGKSAKMLIDDDDLYCFIRTKDGNKVMGLFNLSDKKITLKLPVGIRGKDILSDRTLMWMGGDEIIMKPWQYYLIKNK